MNTYLGSSPTLMLHLNYVLLFASWFLFNHLLVRLAYIFLPTNKSSQCYGLKVGPCFFMSIFSDLPHLYIFLLECAVGSPWWLPCWQKTLQVALPTKIRVRNHLPWLNIRLAFTVWDIMCFCRNNISLSTHLEHILNKNSQAVVTHAAEKWDSSILQLSKW